MRARESIGERRPPKPSQQATPPSELIERLLRRRKRGQCSPSDGEAGPTAAEAGPTAAEASGSCGAAPQSKWRRLLGAAGCAAGSGTAALLLPKCPACLMAYASMWGLGGAAAVVIAPWLRPAAIVVAALAAAWLLWRGWRSTGHAAER